jgi:hypothetical protein
MATKEETVTETNEKVEETTQPQTPVFDEVNTMDQNTALNVLIQVAEMAQKGGILSVRDSVILAKAISVIAPGRI